MRPRASQAEKRCRTDRGRGDVGRTGRGTRGLGSLVLGPWFLVLGPWFGLRLHRHAPPPASATLSSGNRRARALLLQRSTPLKAPRAKALETSAAPSVSPTAKLVKPPPPSRSPARSALARRRTCKPWWLWSYASAACFDRWCAEPAQCTNRLSTFLSRTPSASTACSSAGEQAPSAAAISTAAQHSQHSASAIA